ncbi:hypothetical protein ACEQ8H_001933 [Pleosporales sp. CAS-2024a]
MMRPEESLKAVNDDACNQHACLVCDGSTPVCATCTAVYKTPCHYDPESESRRSKIGSAPATIASVKRQVSAATSSNNEQVASSAEFILTALQKVPEEHLKELISHIRRDPSIDIPTLAESWRKTVTLPPSTLLEIRSLESDLSVLLGKPAITSNGQNRHFGHSAGLGLVPEYENFGSGLAKTNVVHMDRQGTTWTDVTNDLAFVEDLLALYFTWSHPFYVIFSRECFYKDFRAGRDKYCSSLLVNAICAYACHLTDEPAGRTDPSNFRTAGDHFFAEARRLLFEDETPSLTTTQALCIMSMREPSTGRETSGFGYIGRCIRMCVELGLHLNNSASPSLRLTPSEIEVRKVTFWGCFTVDTVWSVCMGRIAQLPRAAIALDKPILDEIAGHPEAYSTAARMPPPIITARLFLQEFTSLSELVNDNNYMFFAPKERLTSTKLLDCYQNYKNWYANLNPALGIEGKKQPEPHILVLHMLYHAIIVHLFRPMLKVDLIHSDVRPRDICVDAANRVSEIVRFYRQLYDFRVAHLAIPHILLSVCIVHLLYSQDDKTSYQNLVEGLQGLEDLHECHYFGARSFCILYTLAKTWNYTWPEELRNSPLVPEQPDIDRPRGTMSPPADPLLVAPNTVTTTGPHMSSTNMAYPALDHNRRRESLSMFSTHHILPTHPIACSDMIPAGIHSVPSPQPPQPPVGHASSNLAYSNISPPYINPHFSSTSSSSLPVPSTGTMSTTAADAADTLFWNPLPGMPGPILPRTNTFEPSCAMGLDTVLQPPDMGDRLVRDGFKMSEDWHAGHHHVGGFAAGVSGSPAPYGGAQNRYAGYATQGGGEGVEYGGGGGGGGGHQHGHGHAQGDYESDWY